MTLRCSKFRSFLCVLLSLMLLVSSMTAPGARASTQDDIDAVKAELEEIKKEIEAQQKVIDELAANRGRIVDRKLAIDGKIELTLRQIELISEQVSIYDGIISEAAVQLSTAEQVAAEQTELLRARVRAMEESGTYSYVSFLFQADSLSDLLSRMGDVDDIMHYDKALEEKYRAACADVENTKRSYEQAQLEQETLANELDVKKTELDDMIAAAEQLMLNIDELSDDAEAEYDEIARIRADAEAELDALVKKLAEEEAARKAAELAAQQAAQQANGGGGGGTTVSGSSAASLSSFLWPVPSCSLITSRFGNRTAPTAGASSYHGGLDIGAAQGATIVAAAGGTVIASTYSNGYGNYVMIDHGGGIVTVYAHMQSRSVSYGQTVSAGQAIGLVGSTGVSTGPHCHYEIRVNGSQTDPAPYYSGLSYYNC